MILNVFPNDVFLAQWQLNQQFFSRSDPRYNHLNTKKCTARENVTQKSDDNFIKHWSSWWR